MSAVTAGDEGRYDRVTHVSKNAGDDRIPSAYLADLPSAISTLRNAWERYQAAGVLKPETRSVIGESWHRSAERQISPDRRAADLDRASLSGFQGFDQSQRVFRKAAALVLQDLQRQLETTSSAVVLCDEFGSILDRVGERSLLRRTERQNFVPGAVWGETSVGTNGIGLALALGRPAEVLGGEHFCYGFQEYACTAAPVRHPVTRAMVGVVDVTIDARSASPLYYALMVQSAGAIERRMEEQLFGRERDLLERYLRRRVALRTPLLTVDRGGRTLIQNAPAAEQLTPGDVSAILVLARQALADGHDVSDALGLALGEARVDIQVAREAGDTIGAVVSVVPTKQR